MEGWPGWAKNKSKLLGKFLLLCRVGGKGVAAETSAKWK